MALDSEKNFFVKEEQSFTNFINNYRGYSNNRGLMVRIKTADEYGAATASLVSLRINNREFRLNSEEKKNSKSNITNTASQSQKYLTKMGVNIPANSTRDYYLNGVSMLELRHSEIRIWHNGKGNGDEWLIDQIELFLTFDYHKTQQLYKKWIINGGSKDPIKENWMGDDSGTSGVFILQQAWLIEDKI